MSERFPLPSAELGAPIHEQREPVKNLMSAFESLYYEGGKITRRGNLPSQKERPDIIRVERAKIYHQVIAAKHERNSALSAEFDEDKRDDIRWEAKRNIAPLLLEAKQRDALAEQYLTQREISVELPGLGVQSSRTIDLVLPNKDRSPETVKTPTIFLIPGISNDVECVGSLALEVAMKGRHVTVVGYPESYNGNVTPEFVKAVDADQAYGPHVAFYKAAIDHLIAAGQEVELWGYSTGCPIVAEILNDPRYQERTQNAVLIAPASSVDQSQASLTIGAIAEAKHFFQTKATTANLMMTKASVRPETDQHKKLRTKTFEALSKKVRRAYSHWKTARTEHGMPIVVVSCENDQITKSDQLKAEFAADQHIDLINIPGAYHTTPLMEPAKIIDQILSRQTQNTLLKSDRS